MSWILKTTFLLTGACCAVLASVPAASAQQVSEYHQEPANPQSGVRYTTGAISTSGWEKGLTAGNPNLKRWNWAAMTTYTQSCYNKVPAGAFLKKDKPEEAPALRPAGSVYVKPIKISADAYARPRIHPQAIVIGETNRSGSVSGHVKLPARQIAQAAPAAKSFNTSSGVSGTVKLAKSYNVNYGAPDTLRPPLTANNLASRQVYGRLVRTQ